MPRPPLLSSSSLHFLKSFCLLVPWAVRLSHSRHTLPIKFKTEASGERVWHFLSLPLSPASCSPSSPAWSTDKPSCEKRGMLVPASHLSQGPHLAPHPGHPTRATPSLDKAWGGGTMHQSVLRSYRKRSEVSQVQFGFEGPCIYTGLSPTSWEAPYSQKCKVLRPASVTITWLCRKSQEWLYRFLGMT